MHERMVDVHFSFPVSLLKELAQIVFDPANADRFFCKNPEPLQVTITMPESERDQMLNGAADRVVFEPVEEDPSKTKG